MPSADNKLLWSRKRLHLNECFPKKNTVLSGIMCTDDSCTRAPGTCEIMKPGEQKEGSWGGTDSPKVFSSSSHLLTSFTNFLWNAFTFGFSWDQDFKQRRVIIFFVPSASQCKVKTLYKTCKQQIKNAACFNSLTSLNSTIPSSPSSLTQL